MKLTCPKCKSTNTSYEFNSITGIVCLECLDCHSHVYCKSDKVDELMKKWGYTSLITDKDAQHSLKVLEKYCKQCTPNETLDDCIQNCCFYKEFCEDQESCYLLRIWNEEARRG